MFQLARAYAAADAFVYASETETMGNVVLEAMASSLGVVVPRAGGIPSLVAQILDRIFELAEGGTELFYTPGNHDAFLRCPDVARLLRKSGLSVQVRDEFLYETQDGRRFVVLHGDRFDVVEMRHQWLSKLLTQLYAPLLGINAAFNRLARSGRSPYACCAFIKNKVKTAVRFFSHFEETLFGYARKRNCDGIICGHIHTPGIRTSGGATYINTGDWVENCTALVEHHDGELVLESFFPNRLPCRVPAGEDFCPASAGQSVPASESELVLADGAARVA